MRLHHGLLVALTSVVLLCLLAPASAAVAVKTEAETGSNSHSAATEEDAIIQSEGSEQPPLEVDDRSWLDVFGQVAKDYLTTQLIPPTDSNCIWDWRVARCEPFCQCALLPAWGDYHLGRSCRYRPTQVCTPASTITFDHLRLEYEEDATIENDQETPALKQILFHTVKALQTTRDHVQNWSLTVKDQTRFRYEKLQEETCAPLTAQDSCIPPEDLSWREALLCQGWESVCDGPQDSLLLIKKMKEKQRFRIPPSWKKLWSKIVKPFQSDDDDDDESQQYNFEIYQNQNPQQQSTLTPLPQWSTASDWSAGIAVPQRKPNKIKRRPRVSPRQPQRDGGGGGGGFAGTTATSTSTASQDTPPSSSQPETQEDLQNDVTSTTDDDIRSFSHEEESDNDAPTQQQDEPQHEESMDVHMHEQDEPHQKVESENDVPFDQDEPRQDEIDNVPMHHEEPHQEEIDNAPLHHEEPVPLQEEEQQEQSGAGVEVRSDADPLGGTREDDDTPLQTRTTIKEEYGNSDTGNDHNGQPTEHHD